MKSFIHLIFLFSICTNTFSCITGAEAAAVLDGYGNQVELGSVYYIKSALGGDYGGGGVTLAATGAQRCPVTVAQEIKKVLNGVACSFHPADPNETVIRVSSSINIKFNTSNIRCAKSTVWRVGSEYIEIEGVLGNPGCDTKENWFKIETGNAPDSYKLVYDPSDVCGSDSETGAADVGVLFLEGLRPLVLTEGAVLNVKFWKHEYYYKGIYQM